MNTNTADVYVQIQDTDTSTYSPDVLEKTGHMAGIINTKSHTRVSHLLKIEYDPKQISSYAILNSVRHQGYTASLVDM